MDYGRKNTKKPMKHNYNCGRKPVWSCLCCSLTTYTLWFMNYKAPESDPFLFVILCLHPWLVHFVYLLKIQNVIIFFCRVGWEPRNIVTIYYSYNFEHLCLFLQVCRRTGDPNKFMFCRRCDDAYHCYCQQPPHKVGFHSLSLGCHIMLKIVHCMFISSSNEFSFCSSRKKKFITCLFLDTAEC